MNITKHTPGVTMDITLKLEGAWLHLACTARLGAYWGFAGKTLRAADRTIEYENLNAENDETSDYAVQWEAVLLLIEQAETDALANLSQRTAEGLAEADRVRQLLGGEG